MVRHGIVATLLSLWLPAAAWSQVSQSVEEPSQEEYRAYRAPDFRGFTQERARLTDHLQLNGSVALQQWYDDNIFLTPDAEESDLITVLVPTIEASFDRDDIHASVDYEGRERRFADHSEFDGMEHFVVARAGWRTRLLHLEVWDDFQDRKEPATAIIFRDRVERRQNDVGASATLDLAQIDVELEASRRWYDVRESAFDLYDHERNQASLLVAFNVAGKTQALGQIGISDTDFTEEVLGDFGLRYAVAGVRTRPTGRLLATAKAGVVRIEQDEADAPGRDDTDWTAFAQVVWRVSIPVILQLKLERVPVETLTSGWSMYTRLNVSYSHWLAERWTVALFAYAERLNESVVEGDRVGYGANVRLRYEPGRNFFVETWIEFRTVEADQDAFDFGNLRGHLSLGVEW
jgi:hypothetical protein